MLFAVPDALTSGGGAEGDIFPGVSCAGAPQNGVSTSCNNRFYANRMGQVPTGFRFPKERRPVRRRRTARAGLPDCPTAIDFWWDEGSAATGGTAGTATRAPTARPEA